MAAAIVGLFALVWGALALWGGSPPPRLSAYHFAYHVAVPATRTSRPLRAVQVFAGTHHTYVVVPPRVTILRAAYRGVQGHLHPVIPHRDGPYWRLDAIRTDWTLTTSLGPLSVWSSPQAAGRRAPARANAGHRDPRTKIGDPAAAVSVARPSPLCQACRVDRPHPSPPSAADSPAVVVRFAAQRLTPQGRRRLQAARTRLVSATMLWLIAFSRHGRHERRAARHRLITVAAHLMAWGARPRRLHFTVFPGRSRSVDIVIPSLLKDSLP